MTSRRNWQQRLKHFVAPLIACMLVGLAAPATAAPVPVVTAPQVVKPTRVLFVGNSYLYYGDAVYNHVQRLAIAAGLVTQDELQYKSATIGGASLEHHAIEFLTRPGQIGVKEPFQLVVLQGGSAEPLSAPRRERFRTAAIEANRIITTRGGRVALYLTHAYVPPHKQAKAGNIRLTEDLYVSVGNEINALVIPVGLAFEEAYRRRPELRLHKEFDGSHPELTGTYLAACTVFASIYGQSPAGNRYDYYGRIDKDTAAFLQQVAADTVKKFYGPPDRP
jgi:hypothetical protein